jgi:hypothetical protein
MCDTLGDRVHDLDRAVLEPWVHREGAEVAVQVELVYFATLGGNELVGSGDGVGACRFAYGLRIYTNVWVEERAWLAVVPGSVPYFLVAWNVVE